MISAVSVPLAIRQAIASARSDINEEKWYKISRCKIRSKRELLAI